MFRRKESPVSKEELRGLILLLMSIDDNVEKIRKEIVEDDGEQED